MTRLLTALFLFALSVRPASAAPPDLLVFIGEKISVEEFHPDVGPNEILMDSAFRAKYRVKEVVFGEYSGEMIEFEAYDHYGRPAFEEHRNVLLFVSRDGERYFHQKYQFYPVFKTLSGAWAGCGFPYAREPKMHYGNLKARDLAFGTDAFFELADLTAQQIHEWYPREYYNVTRDRAYCKKGNTAAELFEVKKHGVLKSRGLF